jgi:hypothetical protein
MMPSNTRDAAILIMAGLAAGMLWLPIGGPVAGPVSNGVSFVLRNDPRADIAGLERRPLLDPSRGQDAAAQVARPATSTQALHQRFLLRGLARIDQRDVAVIEDQTVNRVVRVQRGQVVGAWYLGPKPS